MNIFKKCVLLFFIFELVGCATPAVNLSVKRTPELNLAKVKTIGVGEFTVDGTVHLSADKKEESFKSILATIAKEMVAGGASSSNTPSAAKLQEVYHQDLTSALVRNGYFQVNQDNSAADGVISGRVDYSVNEELHDDSVCSYTPYDPNNSSQNTNTDPKNNTHCLMRKVVADVSFQVAGKNGLVIGASKVSNTKSNTWYGKNDDEVRKQAGQSDVSTMVADTIAGTHDSLIQKIAPYYVTVSLKLDEGESELIKKANKAAAKGDWHEAISLWNEGSKNGKNADQIASIYNLAIYDEFTGKLNDALKKYQDIYASTMNPKYNKDISRVKAQIGEEIKLSQASASRSAAEPATASRSIARRATSSRNAARNGTASQGTAR